MRYVSIILFAFVLFFTGSFKCKNKTTATTTQSNSAASQSNPAIGLNLGNQAPEISMKTPDGKIISLSSLRGKVVLIDFWASWCGPCRAENPAVVEAYTTYKEKKLKGGEGFTIYSVSLDTNLDSWKKAIEKDGLSWTNHVSDLQGWSNEAAAAYRVNGIPANFLVNEKGIIINKNLRGEQLISALDKLVIK